MPTMAASGSLCEFEFMMVSQGQTKELVSHSTYDYGIRNSLDQIRMKIFGIQTLASRLIPPVFVDKPKSWRFVMTAGVPLQPSPVLPSPVSNSGLQIETLSPRVDAYWNLVCDDGTSLSETFHTLKSRARTRLVAKEVGGAPEPVVEYLSHADVGDGAKCTLEWFNNHLSYVPSSVTVGGRIFAACPDCSRSSRCPELNNMQRSCVYHRAVFTVRYLQEDSCAYARDGVCQEGGPRLPLRRTPSSVRARNGLFRLWSQGGLPDRRRLGGQATSSSKN